MRGRLLSSIASWLSWSSSMRQRRWVPTRKQRRISSTRPVTILDNPPPPPEGGYEYRASYCGIPLQVFSQPPEVGELLKAGDTIIARWVPNAGQLWFPSPERGAICAYLLVGGWYEQEWPPGPQRLLHAYLAYAVDPTTGVWTQAAYDLPALPQGGSPQIVADQAKPHMGYYTGGISWGTYDDVGPNIWRSDDMRTGPWIPVLTRSIFWNVVGGEDPGGYRHFRVGYPLTLRSVPGFVAVNIMDSVTDIAYLFHSHDYGTTWSAVALPANRTWWTEYYAPDIAAASANPDIIYGLVYNWDAVWPPLFGLEAWKSTDGGHSMARIDDGSLDGADVYSIICPQNEPNTIYAAFYGMEIWNSVNGGVTWNLLQAKDNTVLRMVSKDGLKQALIHYAIPDGYRALSLDGGLTYSEVAEANAKLGLAVLKDGAYVVAYGQFVLNEPGTPLYVGLYDDELVRVNCDGNLSALFPTYSALDVVCI